MYQYLMGGHIMWEYIAQKQQSFKKEEDLKCTYALLFVQLIYQWKIKM